MEMTFHETLSLVKAVVLSPSVIASAVAILLFLNMVFYVVSYGKHPKNRGNQKRGRAPRPRMPKPAANVSGEEGEGEGDFHL